MEIVKQVFIVSLLFAVWLRIYLEVKQCFQTQIIRIFCIGKGYHRRGSQGFVNFFDAFALNCIVLFAIPALFIGFIFNRLHLL